LSYPKHLILVNDHFYFKVRVPVDLRSHFPIPLIKKSLKTTDLAVAKAHLVTIEYETKRVFTLLRSGMLDDDMACKLVGNLVPARESLPDKVPNSQQSNTYALSEIMKEYSELKQPEWTPKTKMEMEGVFRLLLDILGDVKVQDITRAMMLDLRSKLLRLPANRYKRYPAQTIQQLLDSTDITPMSTKSVNKHVGGISALLR
jgi:hypothetical protein